VVVAAAVAASSEARVIRIAFIFGTFLPLASTAFLFRRRPYVLSRALARLDAPKWAGGYRPGRRKAIAPDVRYFSSEEGHE